MLHFAAVPSWKLAEGLPLEGALLQPAAGSARATTPTAVPWIVPALPRPELLGQAFTQVEFRGTALLDHAQQMAAKPGTAAVLARPPQDLPALLRTADQLEQRARQDAGERTVLWRCECGSRFLLTLCQEHPASHTCERCRRRLELPPAAPAPATATAPTDVNALRHELASFFREAMARGLTVVVSNDER
jgi:hypothetical protein